MCESDEAGSLEIKHYASVSRIRICISVYIDRLITSVKEVVYWICLSVNLSVFKIISKVMNRAS